MRDKMHLIVLSNGAQFGLPGHLSFYPCGFQSALQGNELNTASVAKWSSHYELNNSSCTASQRRERKYQLGHCGEQGGCV